MSNIFELARLSINEVSNERDLRGLLIAIEELELDTGLWILVDGLEKSYREKIATELLILSRKTVDDDQFIAGLNSVIDPSADDAHRTALGVYDNYVLAIFNLCLENDWTPRWTRAYKQALENRLFAFRLLEIDTYWFSFRSRLFGDDDLIRDEYHQKMHELHILNEDEQCTFISRAENQLHYFISNSPPTPIEYNDFPPGDLHLFSQHVLGIKSSDPWISHEAKFLRHIYQSSAASNMYSRLTSEFDKLSVKDPLYNDAVSVTINNGIGSIALIQRHLGIGYNRAACILQQMKESGIIVEIQTGTTVFEGIEQPVTKWIVPNEKLEILSNAAGPPLHLEVENSIEIESVGESNSFRKNWIVDSIVAVFLGILCYWLFGNRIGFFVAFGIGFGTGQFLLPMVYKIQKKMLKT